MPRKTNLAARLKIRRHVASMRPRPDAAENSGGARPFNAKSLELQ